MSLSLLRMTLRRWLRRPAGVLALTALAAALLLTGIPRIEVHLHARGEMPHAAHAGIADHDVGNHASEHHPDGEPVVHAHAAPVAATAIPAVMDIAPPVVMPALAPATGLLSIALPDRPSELFRPPIA